MSSTVGTCESLVSVTDPTGPTGQSRGFANCLTQVRAPTVIWPGPLADADCIGATAIAPNATRASSPPTKRRRWSPLRCGGLSDIDFSSTLHDRRPGVQPPNTFYFRAEEISKHQ